MNDLDRMKKLAGILMENAMAGSESDMQTAATIGVNTADAEFDAAQPQVDESGETGPSDDELMQQYVDGAIDRETFIDLMQRNTDQEMVTIDNIDPYGDDVSDAFDSDIDTAEDDISYDEFNETAPPGMEDVVMKLKKQYPGEPEKAFATAWSIYNKKKGGVDEAFDLNNGYGEYHHANGDDYFPDGADSPVTKNVGPSGARQGDNPEQKRMAIAETHKELVYNYRKFIEEAAGNRAFNVYVNYDDSGSGQNVSRLMKVSAVSDANQAMQVAKRQVQRKGHSNIQITKATEMGGPSY